MKTNRTNKKEHGYKPHNPAPHLLKLSVGHLRAALAGLPDDMIIGPQFVTHVPDEWPGIALRSFGVERDETGSRFCFGIEPIALEDEDAWIEIEQEVEREIARHARYHDAKDAKSQKRKKAPKGKKSK